MDHVDRILAQWRHERPDLSLDGMGLIGRLTRLRHHLAGEMAKTFAAHGLNSASFDVLATLRRHGAPFTLSPGALMASTMVTSGTMTNRIDQLQKAGLIERVDNPEDGRSKLVRLTPAGLEKIDAAVTDHVATQARLLGPLKSGQVERLDDLLRIFLAAFDAPE
jgi:DNA-binding MarR family transcriptional regulator